MKKITVNDLSVEEKLRLICAKGFWYTEDFGGKLPSVCVSDGPVGVRAERIDEKGEKYTAPSVAYPSIQLLANTWSRECVKEMAGRLADDCIEQNVDILLAPGVNIKRHPLNGEILNIFRKILISQVRLPRSISVCCKRTAWGLASSIFVATILNIIGSINRAKWTNGRCASCIISRLKLRAGLSRYLQCVRITV